MCRIGKRHASTLLASMSFDITREILDLTAPCAACVLHERTVPTGAAAALDAHARDGLSVSVPPIAIDAADAAGEVPGDMKITSTVHGSSTVDSE
jgi:hypothetical protein